MTTLPTSALKNQNRLFPGHPFNALSMIINKLLKLNPMKIKILFISICLIRVFASCTDKKDGMVRKNEAVAKAFIESLNSHDVTKFTSLFADTCVYEEVASGRKYKNRDKITIYIESTLSGIPDTKFETINIAANDSIAVVEWIWKGTNTVGWADMGIPATNKFFTLKGMSIMVIEDGLIRRNSDYWDWNSFIRGIGAK